MTASPVGARQRGRPARLTHQGHRSDRPFSPPPILARANRVPRQSTATDVLDLPSSEFTKLQLHLAPLRHGIEAGLTSLRSRLDRLSVAALVADTRGRYLAANRAATTLTGYDRDELERMSVWDLTPVPDLETGQRLWAAFINMGEQRGIYSLRGKHGIIDHIHYLARAHVLPDVHLSLLYRSAPAEG